MFALDARQELALPDFLSHRAGEAVLHDAVRVDEEGFGRSRHTPVDRLTTRLVLRDRCVGIAKLLQPFVREAEGLLWSVLSHDQDGTHGFANDVIGGRPEDEQVDGAAAMHTQHDEVGVDFRRGP